MKTLSAFLIFCLVMTTSGLSEPFDTLKVTINSEGELTGRELLQKILDLYNAQSDVPVNLAIGVNSKFDSGTQVRLKDTPAIEAINVMASLLLCNYYLMNNTLYFFDPTEMYSGRVTKVVQLNEALAARVSGVGNPNSDSIKAGLANKGVAWDREASVRYYSGSNIVIIEAYSEDADVAVGVIKLLERGFLIEKEPPNHP